jgi:endonuclease/exonuclease/phosphatase family metal-dependent hydrolase
MDKRSAGFAQQLAESHPFAPLVLNRAGKALGRTLKVVAFNAKGGARLEGIIRCLQRHPLDNPDLLFLCEADWRRERSAWREFAAELAASLNLSYAYLGEFGDRVAGRPSTTFKGNAILSSQPLHHAVAIPIPNRFLHRRLNRMAGGPAGLAATIHLGNRPVTVGVVHLNSRWDPAGRDWQMREYLAVVPSYGPAIIGGDWNTTTLGLHGRAAFIRAGCRFVLQLRRLSDPRRWEPLFERLAAAGFTVEHSNAPGKRTFVPSRLIPPLIRPNLDWIAVRGLEPVRDSAQAVPARAGWWAPRVSDHDFVMCEIHI